MNHQLPIFVYGTLRPGWGNSRLWVDRAEAQFDGEAVALGIAIHSGGGFPYARISHNARTVGALVHPHEHFYDGVIERMDMLEGTPDHYHRSTVAVETPMGVVPAWVYIANHDCRRLPEVPGNDWSAARLEPAR